MTEADVEALDAVALAVRAWQLGLAPAPLDDRATELPAAEAVFRQLRDRGWLLSNTWVPSRPEGLRGYLEAIKDMCHFGVHYTPETEAHRLLACAVLAAEWDAAQKETP